MVFRCVVPQCGTRYKCKADKNFKYTFHALPFSNPARWRIWTKRCPYLRKYNLRQLESIRICSKHFLPHEIIEDVKFRRLSKDAIPSLHLPQMEAENILEIRPIKRNKPIHVEVVGLNLNFVSQDEMTEAVSKVPFMIAKLKEKKCKFLTTKEMNKIRRKKKRNRLSYLRPDTTRSNLPVDHQLYALPISRRDSFLSVDHDSSTLPQQVDNINLPRDHNLYTLPKPIDDLTLTNDNDLFTLPPIENIVECVTTEHSSEKIIILNDEPTVEVKIEPSDEHFITVTHNEEAHEPNEIVLNMESRDISYHLTKATQNDVNLYDLLSDPVHNITAQAYEDFMKSVSIDGYQHCNALSENELQQDEGDEDDLGSDIQAVTLDTMENTNNNISVSSYSKALENDGDIIHQFLNFAGEDKHCDSFLVNEKEKQLKTEIMDSDLDIDNIQNLYNILADAVNRMSPEIDEDSSRYQAYVNNIDSSVSIPANEQHKPLNSDNIKIKFDTQTENVEHMCEVPTVIPDVISQTNSQESSSVFLTPNLFNLLTSKSPLGPQTIESLRVLFSTIKEKHNMPVDSIPVHSRMDTTNMDESLLNNITLIPSKDNIVTKHTFESLGTQLNKPFNMTEISALPQVHRIPPVNPIQNNDTSVEHVHPANQTDIDNAMLPTIVHLHEERCKEREKVLSQKIMVYKKQLRNLQLKYNRLKINPLFTKTAKTFFQNYSSLSDKEKLLIDLQLRTVGKKKKGLRYTEEELKFASDLYKKSKESYSFLQQYLHLPKSKGTLLKHLTSDLALIT